MRNILEMHDFILNERRASALTLLNDVVGGRTNSVEGIKLSVGMASAFLDWMRMSPYGKKYSKLPFNMLFSAAFVWGLDRYVKGKDLKDEYKELKAKAKEMKMNEVSAEYVNKDAYNFKVGDIVGNTVDGFHFEVLRFVGGRMIEVKDLKKRRKFKAYKDNFYLPMGESLDENRSTPYGEMMRDLDAAMKKAIKKGVTNLRYARDYVKSLERMAQRNAKQFFKDYGDFTEDDWIEDVRYNMANEKVNEIRAKKVTKQMWKKFSDDKRFDALLSVIKDPDDAEEYAFMRWEELPGWMQRDMTLFEKIKVASLADAIDAEKDGGLNKKHLDKILKRKEDGTIHQMTSSEEKTYLKLLRKYKITEGQLNEKEYSTEERKELASKGLALPDGSFPIKDIKDLKNAILSYGRSTDHSEVAKFIAKRAKALGAEDLIPDTENFQKALKETDKKGEYIPYYESFKQSLLEKKPKGAPDFHHSDAPDAEGRFRDLSPKDLAAWLIKTRKKDLKKISGSLTQQVVFNRNDDPKYADKMEKTRIEVYKQLGRDDLLDKKD